MCNLCGELSQMHENLGVKSLVAKGIDLWVGFGLAKFGGLALFSLVAILVNK